MPLQDGNPLSEQREADKGLPHSTYSSSSFWRSVSPHNLGHSISPCPTRATHLYQELFIGQREDVADGGRLVVQAEAGQEQQKRRRCGPALVSSTLAELPGCLAD